MKQLNFKAIIVAVIASWGAPLQLSLLLGLPAMIVLFIASPHARSLMLSGNEAGLDTFLLNSAVLWILCLALSCAGGVLGGLVAALRAHQHPKLNAMATATVGLITSLIPFGDSPQWLVVAGLGLTYPCHWLGALLAMRRRTARSAQQPLHTAHAPISSPHLRGNATDA